jgi:hypothetical protein
MLMLDKACGLGLYPTQKLIQRIIKIFKGRLSSLKKPSSQKKREREREREKKLTERKRGKGGGLRQ